MQAATNPYIDSLDRYTGFLSPEVISRIDVPVLTQTGWQDEQLGSRPLYALEDLDPERTWVVATNGTHGGFTSNPWFSDLVVDFLEHFLRGGTADEFDVAPVHVAREVRDDESFTDLVTYDEWPPPTEVRTLHAQPDGTLALEAPSEVAALDYRYPQPAPRGLRDVGSRRTAVAGPPRRSESRGGARPRSSANRISHPRPSSHSPEAQVAYPSSNQRGIRPGR